MTDTRHLDQALLAVFRYGDWKQATLWMTDDQREAAAEVVQRVGEGSVGVRWWAHTPASSGARTVERLAELLGRPAPPALTPEDERTVTAASTLRKEESHGESHASISARKSRGKSRVDIEPTFPQVKKSRTKSRQVTRPVSRKVTVPGPFIKGPERDFRRPDQDRALRGATVGRSRTTPIYRRNTTPASDQPEGK